MSVVYTIKVIAHVALVICAFIAAYSLRRGLGLDWWIADPGAALVFSWALIYGALAGGYELVFRNERGAWSYASVSDIGRLVRATALTALTFLALIFISSRGITLPRSTLLLSWILSLFALVGIRLAWRIHVERSFRSVFLGLRPTEARGNPLVVVGDPRVVAAYLRRHAADPKPNFDPVAIITGASSLVGQAIHGVRVAGRYDQLETILQSPPFQPADRVALLFVEDPVSELRLGAEMIGRLRKAGRPLLRQPNLGELKTNGDTLREISLEEFLPREPVILDPGPIEKLVSGRRVLVTGAGGSIGSEICRQLVALGAGHITLVDQSEFLLFEIERELVDMDRGVGRIARLCDIRDFSRLSHIFASDRPEIVFHAAALKHVTLVEQNPCEAVLTNILGTWNVAKAARQHGVAQFVLISTDKAVDPSSFMGATKRIAESILPGSTSALRYCVVRFGNVLGSAGSVVPIFRKQIEKGGPVTVTHREVERYFMTIPEAVQLVLHAAAISADAESPLTRKFLLEMGKPVKIYELARQMIELSGLRPGEDIEIEISGLKPGEKLTEELMDSNERSRPLGIGLSELETVGDNVRVAEADVLRLAELAASIDADATRTAVSEMIVSIRGAAA